MAREQQHPIGSQFTREATAAEIVHDIDLTGKTALVTGGYSGLGLESVRALLGAGARVIAPARRVETAAEAFDGLDAVTVMELDLADQQSVARLATQLLEAESSIDIAIATAGVMAPPLTRTPEGWELQFATNHLGHFALFNRIAPLLQSNGGARVVTYSSSGHHLSDINWDDLEFRTGYEKFVAYGQSKTAAVLHAVELDRRGREHGVRAFSVHPGGILTPLQRHMTTAEQVELGWIDEDGRLKREDFKSPEQGAGTGIWAATSPQLDGLGGLYAQDVEIAEISPDPSDERNNGVKRYAIDEEAAKRLWRISAALTGTDSFTD